MRERDITLLFCHRVCDFAIGRNVFPIALDQYSAFSLLVRYDTQFAQTLLHSLPIRPVGGCLSLHTGIAFFRSWVGVLKYDVFGNKAEAKSIQSALQGKNKWWDFAL